MTLCATVGSCARISNRLVVSPLVAFYEVYESINLVRITKIGFFPV